MNKLTQSNEDYIEAIVMLSEDGSKPVRPIDLAAKLGVAKASITRALGVLRNEGLISQEAYGSIYLTEKGVEYGRSMLQRHVALTDFFRDKLGVEAELAEQEACMVEHCISQDTFERWMDYMETHQ